MEKKSSSQPQRARQPTIIGTIFKTIFNLILLTILSWVLLTAWLSAKQFLSVNFSVSEQTQRILDSDIRSVTSSYQSVVTSFNDIFQNIQCILKTALNYIVDSQLNEKISAIVVGSIEIILIRAWLFILSIPFFIVVHFIFVIDGLAQRDIRKFQGARESTFFFHRTKSLPGVIFLTTFFIYMVIPIPISPELILVPMALISGLFTMLSIKNYKKYL